MSADAPRRPPLDHPAGPALPADPGHALRSLLDSVPAIVLTVDLDGRIVSANRSQLGIAIEGMIGRSIFEYPVAPQDEAQARPAFARALQSGEGTGYETCVHWPDGTTRWFACRLDPIERDGRVAELVLVAVDVTARRQMEQTLCESEQRFRRIAEQSPDVIFRLGPDGLEYISPAFTTMLGRSTAERIASPGLSPRFIHPDDLAKIPELVAALDRGPVRCELRMLHQEGHTVWTEHHLMPIHSASGKRIAVEGIVRDISERKRAEAALQAAHRELEARVAARTEELAAANEALRAESAERLRAQEQLRQQQAAFAHVLRVSTMGEMAAGLAHEINQPLGAIANFANGIAARLRSGNLRADVLLGAAEQIAAEALRAGEVIRRLRDFVRRAEARREPTDLNAVVRDAAHLIEPDARHARIALRLALDPRLPPIAVDRVQVGQVLVNLLRNGLEATPDDGGAHEIVVVSALRDGAVEVQVRDTGAGISPASAERLFDAFFTTKSTGLGMGLSISRSIIEDHGGRLWAEGNPDRGSTFAFRIPLAPR